MAENTFVTLSEFSQYPEAEMNERACAFYEAMRLRRSVRSFSPQAVDRGIIENCLRAAGTAPSGANQQPWRFVVVSDPAIKRQIRESAEAIEQEFYSNEATRKWVKDLEHLGTVPLKPFLEEAPYLIAVFTQLYSHAANQEKQKHYYALESVGIATGMLITGLHHAGLATLPYTPVKMRFLNTILGRPANERPFMILVVGYPAANARVPDIQKKALQDIAEFFE